MPAIGKLRYAYLAYLSTPGEDRHLYRLAMRRRVRSVVEIGLGSLTRAVNLIAICQRFWPADQVSYAAVDWFEERPVALESLSLLEAHRELRATRSAIRLTPGGPAGLASVANSLLGTELLVVSPDVDEASLAPAWFFAPRMCCESTSILRGRRDEKGRIFYNSLSLESLQTLAGESRRSQAA